MAAEPRTAVIALPLAPLETPPFGRWTYADAAEALKALLPPDYDVRKAYGADHEHWRNGDEWVGPGDPKGNAKIAKQFAPDDAVGEALGNLGNAFSEPQIGLAPLEEPPEGKEIAAALEAKRKEGLAWLSEWWDGVRLQEAVLDRLHTSAWSGRASLRLWIPPRYLVAGEGEDSAPEIRPAEEIREALGYLHLSAPEPAVAGIVTDPVTQAQCAVFLDRETVGEGEAAKEVARAELVYLDPEAAPGEDAETVVRFVYADEARPSRESRHALGGRLLSAEMRAESLLTDPVLRSQRQLNYLSSILTRLAETGGFPERYITNAKPQGERKPYKEGATLPQGSFLEDDGRGGQWIVTPQERTLGANVTTELVGLDRIQSNNTGESQAHETPTVQRFEPVDPTPYVALAGAVRAKILRMCKQGHLANTSQAESSGMAYEQARANYEKDLNRRRLAEEGMLRELLTAALAWAEDIAEEPGYLTDSFRVTVDQHVDAGPRSPDAVRMDMELYKESILSKETMMARVSVEDVVAEIDRIRKSPLYQLMVLGKGAELATTYSSDGVLRMLVASGAIPQELADAVTARDTDGVVEQ